MFRSLVISFFVFCSLVSSAAVTSQSVSSLTGLNFTVSGVTPIGLPSSCTNLMLDTNGSLNGSGRFATYGTLNCASTNQSFGVTSGTGYITTIGTIGLLLNVGTMLWTCNLNLQSLYGTCNVLNYNNVILGQVVLTFAP